MLKIKQNNERTVNIIINMMKELIELADENTFRFESIYDLNYEEKKFLLQYSKLKKNEGEKSHPVLKVWMQSLIKKETPVEDLNDIDIQGIIFYSRNDKIPTKFFKNVIKHYRKENLEDLEDAKLMVWMMDSKNKENLLSEFYKKQCYYMPSTEYDSIKQLIYRRFHYCMLVWHQQIDAKKIKNINANDKIQKADAIYLLYYMQGKISYDPYVDLCSSESYFLALITICNQNFETTNVVLKTPNIDVITNHTDHPLLYVYCIAHMLFANLQKHGKTSMNMIKNLNLLLTNQDEHSENTWRQFYERMKSVLDTEPRSYYKIQHFNAELENAIFQLAQGGCFPKFI